MALCMHAYMAGVIQCISRNAQGGEGMSTGVGGVTRHAVPGLREPRARKGVGLEQTDSAHRNSSSEAPPIASGEQRL